MDVEAGSGSGGGGEQQPAGGCSKLCGALTVPWLRRGAPPAGAGGAPPPARGSSQLQLAPSVPWWFQVRALGANLIGLCFAELPAKLLPATHRATTHRLAPRYPVPPQVYVLSGRMMKQWVRNPAMLISEISQYAFMALFCGLVWLQ